MRTINRKIAALAILLLIVSMIVGPMVYAVLWKEETTSWINVRVPGSDVEWEMVVPSPTSPVRTRLWNGSCNIPLGKYKINIGGELTLKPPFSDIYEITGGTTFVKDVDFDYEGKITGVHTFVDSNLKTMTWTLFYNITFNPESPNHKIDGMLTIVSHSTIFVDTPEWDTAMIYGFGTGDLSGVTINAGKGPYIYDPDLGYWYITTELGTITGFPTHLIGK